MSAPDNLGDIFSDALAEAVATVAGVCLERVPIKDDEGLGELTGAMSLCGKKGGILFVSANESAVRFLCSCMTGVAEDEVSRSDVEDALCEFVNMTAGSAKLRISEPDYYFNLSTPFVIRGKDITIMTKNKAKVITRVLGNGELKLWLRFVG